MTTETRRFATASTFWYDHSSRDLPSGTLVRTTHRGNVVHVDLDAAAYDSLLNDGRYYVEHMTADAGFEYREIVASAKRVVAKLEASPWPESQGAENAWSAEVRSFVS